MKPRSAGHLHVRLHRSAHYRPFDRYDGINDASCSEKVATLLRQHGYPEVPAYQLIGNKRRSLENHLWLDDYNRPLLDFFTSQLRKTE